jgi:hypothetical protein
MLGDAEEWFYRGLGGIDIDFTAEPNRRMVLRPQVVGNLAWVRSHYDSTWGLIESNWRRGEASTEYNFTLPVNSQATVILASSESAQILVNGVAPAHAAGVINHSILDGRIELILGSGSYSIVAANPPTKSESAKP